MENIKKGYIQIYTGDGKGKTTAALGLAMRAIGNNYKVVMIQFLKSFNTGELVCSKKLEPNFKIYRFEKKRDFFWNLTNDEKEELKIEIKEAYDFACNLLENRECDLLILDEILGAVNNKLLTEDDILELMNKKSDSTELVLTGRNASDKLMEKADLVTEMKPVKHYYNKGVPARKGIEY